MSKLLKMDHAALAVKSMDQEVLLKECSELIKNTFNCHLSTKSQNLLDRIDEVLK